MKEQEKEVLRKIYLACKYEFEVADSLQSTRKREAVQARQLTIYVAKKHKWLKELSLNEIGKGLAELLGRKEPFDHATVIHAYKTVNTYLNTNDVLSREFQQKTLNVINHCERGRILQGRTFESLKKKLRVLQERIVIAQNKRFHSHLRSNHLRIRL